MAKRREDDEVTVGEAYRAQREDQRDRRDAVLPDRIAEILTLRLGGFRVDELSPYHYRVAERLDLFPVHQKWHDIQTNTRGRYITPRAIVDRRLRGSAVTK